MKKTLFALALAAGLTSFAGSAKAELIYNNLRTLPYNGGDWSGGDRITSAYRGEAQSFVASESASIATAAFQLYNLAANKGAAATGSMTAKLFNVSGNSIGSQVGQACDFNLTDIKGPYTAVNVSSFNWSVDAGQKYAVALIGGSNFYNPNGGGDGIYWIGGKHSQDSSDIFNNWNTPTDPWQNWSYTGLDHSVALFTEVVSSYAVASTAAVPEPSQVAASLLLAAGIAGFVIVKRRQEGSDLEALAA